MSTLSRRQFLGRSVSIAGALAWLAGGGRLPWAQAEVLDNNCANFVSQSRCDELYAAGKCRKRWSDPVNNGVSCVYAESPNGSYHLNCGCSSGQCQGCQARACVCNGGQCNCIERYWKAGC